MAANGTPISREDSHKSPLSTTPIKQELTSPIPNATTPTPQPQPETPNLINSLAELRNLSTALSAFYRRYDELTSHLDFIKTALDSKLPDHVNNNNNNQLALIPLPETSPKPSLPEPVNPETLPDNLTNSKPKPDLASATESNPDSVAEPKPDLASATESNPDYVAEAKCNHPALSVLENVCQSMGGRLLRKHIVSHLSDSTKLRDELPKALKLSENPSKLVLECVGRFYLQGSKAYTKERPVIEVRRASVLVLECFLLMDCEGLVIESTVAGEAAVAAVDWRNRIVSEGGLLQASEIDARGLLMLIGGFGIPGVFTNEDIRDLLMTTRARRISTALRRSSYIVPRIPAIIELMVKSKMEVEAADIAYSFGLEDKCPPQKILTTFLHNLAKSKTQGSPEEVKTAKKKQLTSLKSVIKCLEAHKIDPSVLLPESKINEKITSLENEIAELDKSLKKITTIKRKDRESHFSTNKNEDTKRSRLTANTLVHQISPAGHGNVTSSYSGGLERLRSSNINGYPTSPSLIPYGLRRPEDISSSIPAGASLLSSGAVNTNPYDRLYGQRPAGDSAVQMVYGGDGQLYEWRGGAPSRGDAALNERLLTHHAYALQPTSSGLYRSSQSSLEGFAGVPHPSTSAAFLTRGSGSGSDLYRFADSVLESESHRTSSSHPGGRNLPPSLPAHRSSYF